MEVQACTSGSGPLWAFLADGEVMGKELKLWSQTFPRSKQVSLCLTSCVASGKVTSRTPCATGTTAAFSGFEGEIEGGLTSEVLGTVSGM